ncbi:MAG TPA: DNA-directed RNA polymerase subunit omega [Thermotogota bacterium]|nr:DNA-directed RNA polymerase subunit omega [Thermotogota bacterium]HPJ89068.1 DNA-directed RNA polymerase subunit omega [Thermotogota bacterium]HPR95118.1 DNA-directed RNA polymerase subunit omega [Thermotogota bacterium]
MAKLGFNYDELLKKIPYKYAVPVLIGKRAEYLKEEKLLRESHAELAELVKEATKELSENKIKMKNEDMMKLLKPDIK